MHRLLLVILSLLVLGACAPGVTTPMETQQEVEVAPEARSQPQPEAEAGVDPVPEVPEPVRAGAPEPDLPSRLAAGGIITLPAGEFTLAEAVRVTGSLEIRGAGRDLTTITSTSTGSAFFVEGGSLTISGVTLRHEWSNPTDVIYSVDGRVSIVDSTVRAQAASIAEVRGVLLGLAGTSTAQVVGSTFGGSAGNGIEVIENARLDMQRSLVTGNGQLGVVFFGNASGSIADSELSENALHGVGANGNASVEVTGNRLHDNGEVGILYFDDARGVIARNQAYANGVSGIQTLGRTAPRIEGNQVYGNGSSGIVAFESSQPQILGNDVYGNGRSGIELIGDSVAFVQGNRSFENALAGLAYFGNAGGRAEDNSLYENAEFGVRLQDKSAPSLSGNSIYANHTGISYFAQSGGTATGNDIRGNVNGIAARDQSSPTVGGNLVHDNENWGIYVDGAAQPVILPDNEFRGNVAGPVWPPDLVATDPVEDEPEDDLAWLEQARRGGVVQVPPGTYMISNPLVFENSLTLVGAGWDETVILMAADATTQILLDGGDFEIRDMTIEHSAALGTGALHSTNLLAVVNGHLVLSGVDILDAWDGVGLFGTGLVVEADASAHVTDAYFGFNAGAGIESLGALTVDSSTFERNELSGILAWGGSLTVTNSRFYQNAWYGIETYGVSDPILEGNEFVGNLEGEIYRE